MNLARDAGVGWRRRVKKILLTGALTALLVMFLGACAGPASSAAPPPVHLSIDGQPFQPQPRPFIEEDRTLVPLRAVFERLGAQVGWEAKERKVTVQRAGQTVQLWIGSTDACLNAGCSEKVTLDVPARLYDDRTFVPVRFIAEALGDEVDWDAASRTVLINIKEGVAAGPGLVQSGAVTFPGIKAGQKIDAAVPLQVSVADQKLTEAAREIRFFLLDSQTGRGPVVARGSQLTAAYDWLPDPVAAGPRLLYAGLYDGQGQLLDGVSQSVEVSVQPKPAVSAPAAGSLLTGPVDLHTKVNFRAVEVVYELENAQGRIETIATADPYGPLTWYPQLGHNGSWTLRVKARDRSGAQYTSSGVPLKVQVPRLTALTGVKAGDNLARPVTLGVTANYGVQKVQYVLRDGASGKEEVLAAMDGRGQYRWQPQVSQGGQRQLLAVVTDREGQVHRSEPVAVNVSREPALFLTTVGPNQVLAEEVELKAAANVSLTRIDYRWRPAGGSSRTVEGGAEIGATYLWRPADGDHGSGHLQAVGTLADGTTLTSEAIPVRVHTGPLYSAKPIIAKDEFQNFASDLASTSQRRTGMSAAVQVAQAILETGWGQSSPVDKYTGQASNNMFGIKGQGPAGSVTSNTWEEYNGVVFHIDDDFRAYHHVEQSWDDHKDFLLNRERYAPFRAVMHDGIQAAWALRRAGYATDSQYPVKLINLMQEHGLLALENQAP